jgi:hypothetical protein
MQHFLSPEIEPSAAAQLNCPLTPMPAVSAGTLLATLNTVQNIGPFNETFALGEFLEWYGRALDLKMQIIMLQNVVSMRRVHTSNHSTKAMRTSSYVPVLKSLLDRRRTGVSAS